MPIKLHMVVLAISTELRLDSRRVDTVGVQAFANRLGNGHVLLGSIRGGDAECDLDVHGSDNLRVAELPDMDVVAGYNAWNRLNILLDIVDVKVVWCSLEEDLCCCGGKWDGGAENDQGDEEGDGWIGVETLWRVSEPDDKSRDNNTNVAEGITNNVEDHAVHAQVTVIVRVSTLLRLLWLAVIVVLVMNALTANAAICVRIRRETTKRRVFGWIFNWLDIQRIFGVAICCAWKTLLGSNGLDDFLAEACWMNIDIWSQAVSNATRTASLVAGSPWGRICAVFAQGHRLIAPF